MKYLISALLGLTVLAAAAFLITRDVDGPPERLVAESSEERVVQAFRALDAQRRRAFEEKDREGLRYAYTESSPALEAVLESIGRLQRDGIRADEQVSDMSIEVLSVNSRRATIRQEMTFDLRFFDASNTDVTEKGGEERQVIQWTLLRIGNGWKLHSARLVQAAQ